LLHLLARGVANAEIAKELFISDATVRTHVLHVLQKLDLRDRIHAVIYAYETGLIHPGLHRAG
jgi:DNA-binding NarL/FixJ family response regulator